MEEVIYLLRPLHSAVLTSIPPDQTHTIVHLEQGVKDYLLIICLVGSTPFSLFGAFGNNAFSSAAFLTGGNPGYGQPNPMQGTIPAQGANPGIPSAPGPWNSWQGSVPSSGMSIGGNSFHNQWNPGQGAGPMPMGSHGATLPKVLRM
jgi:hypothetical protein